jgi:hypothetical protein
MVSFSAALAYVLGALAASGAATAAFSAAALLITERSLPFVSSWLASWQLSFPLTLLLAPILDRLRRDQAARDHRMVTAATPFGPGAYLRRLAGAAGLFLAAWYSAPLLLPTLAKLLNPFGINGGLALNALLVTITLLFMVALVRFAAQRLADAGAPRVLAVVPAFALALWALVADWIFLLARDLPFAAGPRTPADWTAGFIAVMSALSPALLKPRRPVVAAPAPPETMEPEPVSESEQTAVAS